MFKTDFIFLGFNNKLFSAYSECVAVLLQGSDMRLWVMDVHSVASALCVGQPQQQRVEGFMELLYRERNENL